MAKNLEQQVRKFQSCVVAADQELDKAAKVIAAVANSSIRGPGRGGLEFKYNAEARSGRIYLSKKESSIPGVYTIARFFKESGIFMYEIYDCARQELGYPNLTSLRDYLNRFGQQIEIR